MVRPEVMNVRGDDDGVKPAAELVYAHMFFWPLEETPSLRARDQLVALDPMSVDEAAVTVPLVPLKPAGAVVPEAVSDQTSLTHRMAVAVSTDEPVNE